MAEILTGGARGPSGWLFALLAAGCSGPTGATPYPGRCEPFAVVVSSPATNAEGVPTNTSIDIVLSDYPDPDSVDVETIVLTSGFYRRTGRYAVDLLDKTVRFVPTYPLQPNLTFALSVSRLQSLSGCPLGDTDRRFFRTGAGPGPAPSGPATVAFSRLLDLFGRSCAGATCHRPAGGDGCYPAPPKGLSLCDAEAYDRLVAVPAAELSRMSRVEPRDSARSYLVRKLLPGGGGPAPGTPGARMPSGAGGGLSADDLRAVEDWIDAGAPR